jgi:hypothetical protein
MTLPLWLQIIALVVPAAVAIFSAVWATRSAKRAQQAEHESARLRALEDRVAEKKYALYQPFLQTLSDILTPSRKDAAMAGMEDVIVDFSAFVTVWGSDEVVENFYRWRVSANSSPPPMVTMRLMADLLIAVRKDIAWPDTRAPMLHMIGHRINDITDHPEMVEALTLPWDKFLQTQDWQPPFDVPRSAS